MFENQVFRVDRANDNLLSGLENRDVALWVRGLPKDLPSQATLAAFIGLPWKLVLSEAYDPQLFQSLEADATLDDPLTRKRGFVQIVDADPSRIDLPQRCLPVYLLNGRQDEVAQPDFASRLRRMTMLEELRRSGVRQLLVISVQGDPVPPDLKDLWSSGFRSSLTFVSDTSETYALLAQWLHGAPTGASPTLVSSSASQAIQDLLARYAATYPEERRVLRIRDFRGVLHKIDVTRAEEPERPITESYSLIEDRHLATLTPEELSEEDFVAFFRDPTASWRPYAAGLPWLRDASSSKHLSSYLKKLDTLGSDENCIAYISSESGAGGTTLARTLAWQCAREGDPVLLAKQVPFVPDALPLVNYLNRVHGAIASQLAHDVRSTPGPRGPDRDSSARLYQSPWLIVFDSIDRKSVV